VLRRPLHQPLAQIPLVGSAIRYLVQHSAGRLHALRATSILHHIVWLRARECGGLAIQRLTRDSDSRSGAEVAREIAVLPRRDFTTVRPRPIDARSGTKLMCPTRLLTQAE
jgi:hypothetical protein